MNLLKKQFFDALSLIIILHLISRVLIYFLYLKEKQIFFSEEFIEALSNKNFLEYLLFHHSIPIGNILLSKFALILSGKNNLYIFYYILNSTFYLMLLLALGKIYFLIFKKYSIFLFFVLILISISFTSYDSWRVNHYDHVLIFLFSLLNIFFAKILLTNKKIKFDFKYILLMIFILLFSNLFIVIFLIFNFVLLLFHKKFNIDYKSLIYSTIIVLLFFSSLLIKNKISIGDYTPTSIKGWNFIQRPVYTLGHDKYFDLYLEKLNLSKINRICVSDVKKNKDKFLNSNNNDLFLSLVLHKCFFDKEKSIYDYNLLKNILNSEKINDSKLDEAISLDINDLSNKKWKFSGGHEDINLRTTVFFHKESLKVYLSSFIFFPYEMLIGSISTKDNQGVLFTFLNSFRWGGQLPYYYEPQYTDIKSNFLKILQILFSVIILIGLFFSLIRSYKLLFSLFYKKKINNFDILIFLLLLLCLCFNLMTALITCCENQRNSVMIFPFIITVSTLSISIYLKKYNKIIKKLLL